MKEDTIFDANPQVNAQQNYNSDAYREDEETLYEREDTVRPAEESGEGITPKKKNNSWVNVTLGGVSGILLGAGAMFGAQQVAAQPSEPVTDGDGKENPPVVDDEPPYSTTVTNEEDSQPETSTEKALDDMSFSEAFATARAEMGPGHAFTWHGNIYSTYTAEEWKHLTPETQQGQVDQAHGNDPTFVYIDKVEIHHHGETVATGYEGHGGNPEGAPLSNPAGEADGSDDGVSVVGSTEYDGHYVALVDTNSDGEEDIAIIDMDDDMAISDPDIVIDTEGNMATVGQLTGSDDINNYSTSYDESVDDAADDATDDSSADDDMYLATLDDTSAADDMAMDAPDYITDPMA